MKCILVTGGAGFLGSHLCDELLSAGHRVVCLDDLSTGSLDNIAQHRDNPDFLFIEQDVRNPIALPRRFEEVEQIYNLACPASPVHYQADPIRTTMVCVQGAINVLELARERGARVLQASTSEVYGDPDVHPQPEGYWGNVNTTGKRSCYDEGKRVAESLFFDYYREHGVQIKVARIFNTYGPRMSQDDGRVVSNFITQALQGEDITLYGKGEQTRSFCYVDDLVDGLIRLMVSPDTVIGPVNLGNPGEFTMIELAELVLELTGSHSILSHAELPQDDPTRRKPDIAKAQEMLGWKPVIPLEVGLGRTVEHFCSVLGLAPASVLKPDAVAAHASAS